IASQASRRKRDGAVSLDRFPVPGRPPAPLRFRRVFLTPTFSPLDLYGVLLGGLAAAVLGLVLCVGGSRQAASGRIAGLLVLLCLGGAAVAAALLELPRSFLVSLSGLAGAWVMGW